MASTKRTGERPDFPLPDFALPDFALPDFALEEAAIAQYGPDIAGVDEAGRGPWAGPVVAAAVILDQQAIPRGLDDSKRLTARAREALFEEIRAGHVVGVAIGEVARIDRDNILQATLWSMAEACGDLARPPAAVLIDGNRAPELSCPSRTVIGGDRRSLSIAAASIVAKVTRDRLMRDLARDHAAYGWERNKGYGTKEHARALRLHGVTVHHRRSFRPVADALRCTAA